jgi:hypothetical protein
VRYRKVAYSSCGPKWRSENADPPEIDYWSEIPFAPPIAHRSCLTPRFAAPMPRDQIPVAIGIEVAGSEKIGRFGQREDARVRQKRRRLAIARGLAIRPQRVYVAAMDCDQASPVGMGISARQVGPPSSSKSADARASCPHSLSPASGRRAGRGEARRGRWPGWSLPG